MLKWPIILLVFFISVSAVCQNLVPNSSFENFTESFDSILPFKNEQLLPKNAVYTDSLLKYSPNFGICQSWCRSGGWVTYENSTLSEKYPYKYAYSVKNCKSYTGMGSAFMRIGLGFPGKNGILYTRLEHPLIKDSVYKVRFMVFIRDSSTSVIFNSIGATFSTDVPSCNETDRYNSFEIKNIQSFKVNQWNCVEGVYRAAGNEVYLIIGKYRVKQKVKFRKGRKNADPCMEINIDDVSVETADKSL